MKIPSQKVLTFTVFAVLLGLGEAYAAEPSQITSFYPDGAGPSVAERLKPGYRAVSIALDAGDIAMVQPGTIVDVLFRVDADEAEQSPEATLTLMEAVEVVALGSHPVKGPVAGPDPSREQPSYTAALAVTPEQARTLKTVERRGTISLAVRHPEDKRVVAQATPQTLGDVVSLPRPEAPFVTEIYRRGVLTTMEYQNGVMREAPAAVIASQPTIRASESAASDSIGSTPSGSVSTQARKRARDYNGRRTATGPGRMVR